MYAIGALLGVLHAAGALLFLIGLIFLLVWSVKQLKPQQMKKWGIVFLVVGVALCILTIAMSKAGPWKSGWSMRGPMMKGGDMGVSMMHMNQMLKGKTGDEFDKAFIEQMIVHHQGAIDMANAAKQSAKHAEIKNLSNAIITAQQREIDQMKAWQKSWGYVK